MTTTSTRPPWHRHRQILYYQSRRNIGGVLQTASSAKQFRIALISKHGVGLMSEGCNVPIILTISGLRKKQAKQAFLTPQGLSQQKPDEIVDITGGLSVVLRACPDITLTSVEWDIFHYGTDELFVIL
jgi:hypothetical protein